MSDVEARKETTLTINWRRGFFRLWVAGSVGWALYNLHDFLVYRNITNAGYNVSTTDYVMLALIIVLPPLLMLLALWIAFAVGRWLWAGFAG